MILRWREFEKRLRRVVRDEIGHSPVLKAEYKRHRVPWSSKNISPWGGALVTAYLVLMLFGKFAAPQGEIELGLAVISLWATGTAFRYAQKWFQHFYASDDLVVFSLLPLSDEMIFRVQWRQFLFNSLYLLGGYGFLYGVAWFMAETPPLELALVIPAALLQASTVLALGLSIAAWVPLPFPLGPIAGLLRTAALVLLFSAPLLGPSSSQVYKAIFALSPNGWVNFLLLESATSRDLTTLLLLVPIAIVLYASVYAWHRLRSLYTLANFEFFPASSAMKAEADELEAADFARRGPTEIHDNIIEGSFLKSIPWESFSWFERTFSRFLTPRERTLIEFLVGETPGWSKSAKWVLTLLGFTMAAVWAFGKSTGYVVFIGGYLLLASVTSMLGSSWRGFSQLPSAGSFIPAYSAAPVSFGELARLLLKFNLARLLLAAPVLAGFTIFSGWCVDYGIAESALLAGKILLLLVAVQPLLILMPISKSTNDVARMKLVWFFLLFPLAALVAAGAVVFFTASTLFWLVISYASAFLAAILFFLTYRWAYRTGKFDLIARRVGSSS